jgi:4-hydroxy-2-oxoheptanedioate aldolase
VRENHVLNAWRENKQTIGGWLSIDSIHSAETMAHIGFDWLCLDMQHGLLDFNDIKRILPAISTTSTLPFVRVPWNEPYEIMKVLDAGAYGVIVPLVNNREEAERAVSACRYPPEGMRSLGPIRAALYGGPGYIQEANEHMACIVMIETAEALENLDDILSTPGVNAAYIGPSDLAYALNMAPTGDNSHPEHLVAVKKILAACQKNGVAAGIHTLSLEYSLRYLDLGFNFVSLGADIAFLSRLARKELKEARTASNNPQIKT